MKRRFYIQTREGKRQVSLELTGEFDASAAVQLLSALRHHWALKRHVTVNTSALNRFEAVGLNLMRYNLGAWMGELGTLTFAGTHADVMRSFLPAMPSACA